MNTQSYTNEQIQRVAPSVFAGQAASRTSDRYAFIPTINIVDKMRDNGWFVTHASESRTKQEDRKGFVKHMLRFSPTDERISHLGDSRLEVVLINSHDGSSQYSLQAGVFRLVCSNGMVVADSLLEAIKVRHTGNVIDNVLSGSERILENAPIINQTIQDWQTIELTQDEQGVFAQAAHALRFPEGSLITPKQMLQSRRPDDNGNSLWNVFNRVQEHSIKGGDRSPYISRFERNANPDLRRVRSREVKNISGNVNLNKALWQLAEGMAALKK